MITFLKKSSLFYQPEIQLILACSRTNITPERRTNIQNILINHNLDWSYLINIAISHGVMPLVYYNLNQIGTNNIPVEVICQLRHRFHANTLRNLFLTQELIQVLELLNAQGLPAIPFKGSILANLVYGSLSLRHFSDLDILIEFNNLEIITKLLLKNGYELVQKMSWQYGFFHQRKRVNLDIHWEIIPSECGFSLPVKPLWERKKLVDLLDKKVFTFSPEDILLILCLQGCKDGWRQLSKVCDIAQLIATYSNLNWSWLIKEAKLINSERMVLLGLDLSHELLAADLPEEVLIKIQSDSVIKSLTKTIKVQIFDDSNTLNQRLGKYLIRLQAKESLPNTMKDFIYLVLIPKPADLEFISLPMRLSAFYYVIRPLRLLFIYSQLSLYKIRHLFKQLFSEN